MGLFSLIVFLIPFAIGFGVLLPGALILAKVQATLRRKKIERDLLNAQSIIVEYKAPKQFKPAELGFLYDGFVGNPEVASTLIDLTNRGYLITENKVGKPPVYKTSFKDRADLKEFEQLFMGLIEQHSSGISRKDILKGILVKLKDAQGQEFIQAGGLARALQNSMKSTLVKDGYYDTTNLIKRMLLQIFIISAGIAVLVAALEFITLSLPSSLSGITYNENGRIVENFSSSSIIGISIALGVFTFMFSFLQVAWAIGLYYKKLGYGAQATDKLKEIWPDIEGYKMYLRKVELEKINFELLETKNINQPHLPYAIALNLPLDISNIV